MTKLDFPSFPISVLDVLINNNNNLKIKIMKKLVLISALILSLAIVGSANTQVKKVAPVAKEAAAPVAKKSLKKASAKKKVAAEATKVETPVKPVAPAKKK